MRDVELYQQLLGLVAPWTVGGVELSVEGERVDIWAAHAPGLRWPCPECETVLPVYMRRSVPGGTVAALHCCHAEAGARGARQDRLRPPPHYELHERGRG